jgi:hypothetical protein
MSPHSRRVTKRHPYAAWNEVYRNFQPTEYEVPAYSADCVPFRWMLRDSAVDLADAYRLPYESELEAAIDSEASLNDPSWVQHAKNQQLLLDTFFPPSSQSAVCASFTRRIYGAGLDLRVELVQPEDCATDCAKVLGWNFHARMAHHPVNFDRNICLRCVIGLHQFDVGAVVDQPTS